jgi:hypothetical protein
MWNSTLSVNKVGRSYSVPSLELRHGRRGIAHAELTPAPWPDGAEVNSLPAVMPTTTRADAPWSSVFAFFIEGFALYAASYCVLPHAIARSPVESGHCEISAFHTDPGSRRS